MKKQLLFVLFFLLIGLGSANATDIVKKIEKFSSETPHAIGNGVSFSVFTSYYPNLSLKAGKSNNGIDQYEELILSANGVGILPEGWQFISFSGKDDAKIVSISRNGAPLPYSSYVGWRSLVEEGDIFTVVTTGPNMDVNFKVNETYSDTDLNIFNINVNDTPLNLTGLSQTVTLHRGDQISISGKGKNVCDWVKYGDSLYDAIPATFNIVNNENITISGSPVKDVFININNASSVVIKQLNGYGAELEVHDGENQIPLSDIKNNLSITPADGSMITSVIVNQSILQPANTGDYSVTASDGMLIEIQAKPIPTTIPLTVMVCDTDNNNASSDEIAANIKLKVDGIPVTLEGISSVMAPYMSEVTISGSFGFVLDKVEAGKNFVQEEDQTYTFFAEDACTVMIYAHQIVAPEGYALVQFIENSNKIGFYPYDENKERLPGAFNAEQPAVIQIGNYVGVKKFSYDFLFKSITVNGKPIKIDENQEAFQEYLIEVSEDCIIEALLFDPNEGTLLITCWDSHDGTYGIKIADLYVNDHGTLTKKYNAAPGEEVEFVLPYTAPGFNLKYLAGKSVSSPDLKDLTSLKFKVPQTVINPETGDPYIYIFEPLCEVNSANPPYLLEFYPTYIDSEEVAGGKEVVGYLVGIDPYENAETTLMFATAGQEVTVLSYERDDYIFERMFTTNGRTIQSPYTVDAEDAFVQNGYNKINLGADYKPRGEGVEQNIIIDKFLSYNKDTQRVESIHSVRIFDMNGKMLIYSEGDVSVSDLAPGIYIAVSDSDSIKFIKQ